MHDILRGSVRIAAAAFVILSLAAQSRAGESPYNPTQTAYFYCSSEPGQVVYFSDIFLTTTNATIAQNAFLAYLKTKYSFKSTSAYPVGCPSFGKTNAGLSLAKTSKEKLQTQYKQSKSKIVETDWKYAL